MKGMIFILFSVLVSNILFAQEQVVKDTVIKKFKFGFCAGILSSQFYNYDNKNNYYTNNVYTGKKIFPGITAGCFISFPSANKHFSMQPQIDYNFSHYRVNADYISGESPSGSSNRTIENFSIYASSIQLSILPTIKLGNRIKTCIKVGPSFNIPIGNIVKGYIINKGTYPISVSDTAVPGGYYIVQKYYTDSTMNNKIKVDFNNTIGLLIGVGMTFPIKGNTFGFYLKDYISPFNFGNDFYFEGKQNLVSICLTYQIK